MIRIKISAIAAILLLMITVSCSTSLQEQIIGAWALGKSTIPDLDSISAARSADHRKGLMQALEMVKAELDTCRTEPLRTELASQSAQLQSNISSFTPEYVKNLFLQQQKQLEDSLMFIIGSDGRFSIRIGFNSDVEENVGSWKLRGDTIYTSFDNNPSELLLVRSVNAGRLVLESMPVGAYGVSLILELNKM